MADCDPFLPDLPDCDIDLGYTGDDLDVWEGAYVVREAARCIAEAGFCADAYKCSKGKWKLGTCNSKAPHGIVTGPAPIVEDDCCGSITVAVRYPPTIETNNGCYTRFDVEYEVKVTWPCDWDPYQVLCETARFTRLLPDVVCCKTPDIGKAGCGNGRVSLAGIEDDLGDECPSVQWRLTISK